MTSRSDASGYAIYGSEGSKPNSQVVEAIQQALQDQARYQRAKALVAALSGLAPLNLKGLDALTHLPWEESAVVDALTGSSNGHPRVVESEYRRQRVSLKSNALVLGLCYPRLFGTSMSVAKQIDGLTTVLSEAPSGSVGLVLSPVSEPLAEPYAPYSPKNRLSLDTEVLGGSIKPLRERHRWDFETFLGVIGLRGIIGALFRCDPERFAGHHPLWCFDALDLDRGLVGSATTRLVEEFRVFDFWQQQSRKIPIIHDLPVGFHRSGYDAWLFQDFAIGGFELGAPPDALALGGQRWGLQVMDPVLEGELGLVEGEGVARLLSQIGTGVRLDHALGLRRRYLQSESTDYGAYLAPESNVLFSHVRDIGRRYELEVIGEDLGVVPEGFRDTLAGFGLGGMAVPYFEAITDPESVQGRSLCLCTFDLPTVTGLLGGQDARELISLGRSIEARNQIEFRSRLSEMVVTPPSAFRRRTLDPEVISEYVVSLVRRSVELAPRATWVMIEDVLGVADRANIPGSNPPQRLNWRRPMALDYGVVRGFLRKLNLA